MKCGHIFQSAGCSECREFIKEVLFGEALALSLEDYNGDYPTAIGSYSGKRSCDCGAAKTSNPNCHSSWCSTQS